MGGDRLASKVALESFAAKPFAAIDYFDLFATAIDLSDLGFAPGERVNQLQLKADPVNVGTDQEPQYCFYIDPVLIVGLPPARQSPTNPQ